MILLVLVTVGVCMYVHHSIHHRPRSPPTHRSNPIQHNPIHHTIRQAKMPRANRLLAFPSQGPVNIEEALMRRIEECVRRFFFRFLLLLLLPLHLPVVKARVRILLLHVILLVLGWVD